LPEDATPALQLLVGMAVTLAIASCTRHAIEKPAIELGRRLGRRDRSSNGSDTPPPLAAR
jgi:peptidoglycan/LPS O-acetylase OafA/YrhL